MFKLTNRRVITSVQYERTDKSNYWSQFNCVATIQGIPHVLHLICRLAKERLVSLVGAMRIDLGSLCPILRVIHCPMPPKVPTQFQYSNSISRRHIHNALP